MFQGTCEADTTYIGGKYENMHKAKKETKPQKAVVLGIVNRETKKVKSFHIENESYVVWGEKILDNVDLGSELIADERKSCVMLKYYFKHSFINHSKGEYSRQDLSRVALELQQIVLKVCLVKWKEESTEFTTGAVKSICRPTKCNGKYTKKPQIFCQISKWI
jgi:hypothetical protein